MEITSIGIVTPGCKDCMMLKKMMSSLFSHHDIEISFEEIDCTVNDDYAMEIAEQYGFDDIPAFEVMGVVFKKGFQNELVQEAVDRIGC